VNGRYTDGIASRLLEETDKTYAKRVIDLLPAPDPGFLLEDPSRYFDMPADAQMIRLDCLKSRKTPDESAKGGNAALNRMAAASEGVLSKRAPIEVVENEDGSYTVLDGNSTLTAARLLGWKQLPVRAATAPRSAGCDFVAVAETDTGQCGIDNDERGMK
jgi:hypothetical protein